MTNCIDCVFYSCGGCMLTGQKKFTPKSSTCEHGYEKELKK